MHGRLRFLCFLLCISSSRCLPASATTIHWRVGAARVRACRDGSHALAGDLGVDVRSHSRPVSSSFARSRLFFLVIRFFLAILWLSTTRTSAYFPRPRFTLRTETRIGVLLYHYTAAPVCKAFVL